MSTQASVPKKVYKLSPVITPQSLPVFRRNFLNVRGNYGAAGEAVATGIPYDASLKIKTAFYTEQVELEDGTITDVTRKFDNRARQIMTEYNKNKTIENRDYQKHCGPLWSDMHEVISQNVLDRIKSDDKAKYEKAQKTLNVLHLSELITQACQGLNRNHIKKIEQEWDKCVQGEMRFETFVVKHEEKHDALVSAGKEISDNEFCVHLRDHVNLSFGQAAVPEAYNTDPSSPNFPSYDEFRGKCWALAQTLAVIRNQQPKESDKEDKKPQDKGNGKRKATPDDVLLGVMSAKVIDKVTEHFRQVGAGANKKAKTGGANTPKPEALIEFLSGCWNCKKDGHPYFKCTSAKVTCTTCKAKGHCAEFHDAFQAHAERRKAAREELLKNTAPVKHGKSVKIAPDSPVKDDTPVAHTKSLIVAPVQHQSPVIARGIIGDYLGAVTNTARTFSVRVVGENITSDMETEADSELAQPPSVLPEDSMTHDEYVEHIQGYLREIPDTKVSEAEESKEVHSVDSSVPDTPSAHVKSAVATAQAQATHELDESDLDLNDNLSGSEHDLHNTDSESDNNKACRSKPKRKKHGKHKVTVEEEEEQPMQTRSRSRSNSLSTIDPNPGENSGIRKAPTPRSPSQATNSKYRPAKGNSPPSQSSVDTNPFPYRSPALQQWPQRAVPTSEEEKAAGAKADADHFNIDTSNREGLYKYYAGVFKKYEFIEALLSLINNQPNSGKSVSEDKKVSVSVHAASKACAHNYKKYVDNTWPKDKYMGLGKQPKPKELNAQAAWFGELHEAAVARGATLRAIGASLDEMFDSPRARAFWEELTGVMDPVLPWSMLSQTSLRSGSSDPQAQDDSGQAPEEPENQPSDRTRRSSRLTSMIPKGVVKSSKVHPVLRQHYTKHTLHDSPTTGKLIDAPRLEASDIWADVEKAELVEIKEAEAETTRQASLTAAEIKKEQQAAEALAKQKADREIEAENAALAAAAKLLREQEARNKPASSTSSNAKVGTARGDFGSHPAAAASQKAKKGQEAKQAKATAAKAKPQSKSGEKSSVEQQRQQLQTETACKPIARREVVDLAEDSSSGTFTASPTDLKQPMFYAFQKQNKVAGSRRAESPRERREREDPRERDSRRAAASPRRQHDDRGRFEREDRYGTRIAYGEPHDWSHTQAQVRDRERSDSRDRSRNDSRHGSSDRHPGPDSRDRDRYMVRRSPDRPRRDSRASDKRSPPSPYASTNFVQHGGKRSDYAQQEHRQKKARLEETQKPTATPPEPVPEMLDDDHRVVKWYKKFDQRKLEGLGLRLRPFKIGNLDLYAASSATEFITTEKLLRLLHFVDEDDTATSNPKMVNVLLETEFDLKAARDLHNVKMTARELQAGAAFTLTATLPPETREGDVIIDSGATVTLAKNSRGLRHFRDENRRLRLLTAGGDYLHSDRVGKLRGMGTVVVTKGAADNLLSVLQVCRANSDVRFEFQGCNATIHHPGLDHPLRAHIGMDDQYTLRREDFQTLQRVLGDEARTFTVTTESAPEEPEAEEAEELEEAMSSVSVNDTSEMPATDSTRPVPAREATQQILHDTVPPVTLTKQQLARAKEHET